MTQLFECPSCGAGLEYTGDAPVVRCGYCDGMVVVPETLRPPAAKQQQTWTQSAPSGEPLSLDLGDLMSTASSLKQVKELVREGRNSEAVQLYQEAVGVSWEDSEEAVRRLASGQSIMLSSSGYGSSAPVVSGREAAVLVAEQFESVRRQTRNVGRIITCVVLGVVVMALVIVGCVVMVGMNLFQMP